MMEDLFNENLITELQYKKYRREFRNHFLSLRFAAALRSALVCRRYKQDLINLASITKQLLGTLNVPA